MAKVESMCQKVFPLSVTVESAKEQNLCDSCDPVTKFMCRAATNSVDIMQHDKEDDNE